MHLNGGFARAARFPASRLLTPLAGAETLLAAEDGAMVHMNADRRDALCAEKIADKPKGEWLATGIDPDGMDLACGDLTRSFPSPCPSCNPSDLRKVLVEMASAARGAR